MHRGPPQFASMVWDWQHCSVALARRPLLACKPHAGLALRIKGAVHRWHRFLLPNCSTRSGIALHNLPDWTTPDSPNRGSDSFHTVPTAGASSGCHNSETGSKFNKGQHSIRVHDIIDAHDLKVNPLLTCATCTNASQKPARPPAHPHMHTAPHRVHHYLVQVSCA